MMAGQSLHMRCGFWAWPVRHDFIVDICYHSLFPRFMFQGISGRAADPVQRKGNNQPDLLNVKAQKDASG